MVKKFKSGMHVGFRDRARFEWSDAIFSIETNRSHCLETGDCVADSPSSASGPLREKVSEPMETAGSRASNYAGRASVSGHGKTAWRGGFLQNVVGRRPRWYVLLVLLLFVVSMSLDGLQPRGSRATVGLFKSLFIILVVTHCQPVPGRDWPGASLTEEPTDGGHS